MKLNKKWIEVPRRGEEMKGESEGMKDENFLTKHKKGLMIGGGSLLLAGLVGLGLKKLKKEDDDFDDFDLVDDDDEEENDE